MTTATVYLVDDNAAFRSSTQWLLESHHFEVKAFADGASFMAHYRAQEGSQSECLLLDIRMPQMSGLQVQEALSASKVHIPIVFITAHGDVPMAVETMRKGATNFLEKPFAEDALVDAVRFALASGVPAPPASGVEGQSEPAACMQALTTRERQVLELVLDGKYNKTIGDILGISIKTVELHRARLMEKMQVKSVAELVQKTLRGLDERRMPETLDRKDEQHAGAVR
jgi:two-component system, LuxR family, response regulator FixJ